ncbi:AMP-binding protein [Nocardioides sp.]|uniref:AMP-binding protein n=1 Tax=Nocardioides sp. TaxID=35761 RepID=UPI003D0FFDDE
MGELLREQARLHGGTDLLHFEDEAFTFAEVNALANRYAHSFLRIGVEPGDKVCTLMSNCPDQVFWWMGLAKLAAVHAPVNNEFRGSALVHLVESTDATVLFLDHAFAERLGQVADRLTKLTSIVFCAPGSWTPPTELTRFKLIRHEDFLASDESDVFRPASPGDPLMLLFTSGTTGPAKAVEISHNYALHSASERIWHIGLTPSDVLYSPYPLYHGAAPLCVFLPSLLLGTTAVLAPRFRASTFWDEMRRHGVTFFDFMGAVLVILFKQEPKANDADNPVRITVGIPAPGIWKEFEERFAVKVMELYGSMECCEVAWDSLDEPHRVGACGRVCEHHDVRIFDDQDVEMPQGEVGQIVVRAHEPFSQMSGYYGNPEATVEACRNLWFHTGDNGYFDEDGWLHFVDRKKDAIRRRGKNISSFEVEDAINAHPDVLESAAIGVPSEFTEEEVKVVVVPRHDSQLTIDEVVQFARNEMARYMVPRFVELVDELPKTTTGKANKNVLRAQWKNISTWDSEGGAFLSALAAQVVHKEEDDG